MSADFLKIVANSCVRKGCKVGQLSDFADSDAAEKSVDYPMLGSGKLPSNGLMTNVYRNINAQKRIHILWRNKRFKPKLASGSETIQMQSDISERRGAERDV
ncbi:MAG: hypothetical protein ACLUKN_06895 [Bacilli bacterium]